MLPPANCANITLVCSSLATDIGPGRSTMLKCKQMKPYVDSKRIQCKGGTIIIGGSTNVHGFRYLIYRRRQVGYGFKKRKTAMTLQNVTDEVNACCNRFGSSYSIMAKHKFSHHPGAELLNHQLRSL
ncbi:hypothetical protein BDW62DRAFT_120945 [Aspergillus aurantiobrunneus]